MACDNSLVAQLDKVPPQFSGPRQLGLVRIKIFMEDDKFLHSGLSQEAWC